MSQARFIQGPPSLLDFRPGDDVAHIMLGDGTVERVDSAVHVVFARAVNGKPVRGAYDRRWFETHPRSLFHRNVGAA